MVRSLTVFFGILTLVLAVGLATSPGQAVLGLSADGPRVIPIRDSVSAASARTHAAVRQAGRAAPAHAGPRAPGAVRMHTPPRAAPARTGLGVVSYIGHILLNLPSVLVRAPGHPGQRRDGESR